MSIFGTSASFDDANSGGRSCALKRDGISASVAFMQHAAGGSAASPRVGSQE